jgi:hypothetical protein
MGTIEFTPFGGQFNIQVLGGLGAPRLLVWGISVLIPSPLNPQVTDCSGTGMDPAHVLGIIFTTLVLRLNVDEGGWPTLSYYFALT